MIEGVVGWLLSRMRVSDDWLGPHRPATDSEKGRNGTSRHGVEEARRRLEGGFLDQNGTVPSMVARPPSPDFNRSRVVVRGIRAYASGTRERLLLAPVLFSAPGGEATNIFASFLWGNFSFQFLLLSYLIEFQHMLFGRFFEI